MLTKEQIEDQKISYYIQHECQATEDWLENLCDQAILAIQLQAEVDQLKAERRWVPVSERLPEEGQTVEIRKTSDYYTAIYRPSENQFIPWELLDESMKRTMLWRRREAVDEWRKLPQPPEGT